MRSKNRLREPIYLDPTSDYGFKKLFGEPANKDLLIDFLNSMLPERHQIADLTFRNAAQLSEEKDLRNIVFDIFCTANSGEHFIVEMQKARQDYFLNRTVYYTSKAIVQQGKKGKKWQYDLATVYFFGILNFAYDQDLTIWKRRQLLRSFELTDKNGVQMSDKMQFNILQLPFFNKKPHQLKTRFDKWCYFLKNLENLEHIPHILNEPIFMKALSAAQIRKLEPLEAVATEMAQRAKMEYEAYLAQLKAEAQQKGREQGMEKGIEKGIENLLQQGILTVSQIADAYKLPISVILDIKSRLKL